MPRERVGKNMNKKKVIVLIVALVILVVAIVCLVLFFNKRAKYVYDVVEVSNIEYNVINVDNRSGVIDGDGNIIIEPTYNVIQIPDPSKPVFICMSDYNTETKEYQTKVLNEKREQILTGYESVQAIPNETTADGIPFEKTALKYKKDGKYGLLNINGDEITDPIFDEISSMTYKEGMFLVKQNDKLGVINQNGVFVIEPEYDNITADNYYDVETKYQRTGFIVCKIEENGYRYGYINYKGDMILKPEFSEVERVTELEDEKNVYLVAYKDGQAGLLRDKKVILNYEYESISYNAYNDVFVVQRNGKQGIVDREGETKLDTKYTEITFGGIYVNAQEDGQSKVLDLNGNEVTNGYISSMPTKDGAHSIVYGEDEIYKIIDNSGNVVVDKNYTYIEELDNNYFIVANYNNNGIIDLTGKSVIDLRYSSIFKLDGTELIQANDASTNTISLINKNMEIVVTMAEAEIEVEDSYVKLYSEDEIKYFDLTGKELTAQEVFPNHQLFAKKINDKWGFVDKDGNLQVQNEYDLVTDFNEYGFAGIMVDGKWGVIKEDKSIVVEPKYELDSISPMFIGEYYMVEEWYGNDYYTNETDGEEAESQTEQENNVEESNSMENSEAENNETVNNEVDENVAQE